MNETFAFVGIGWAELLLILVMLAMGAAFLTGVVFLAIHLSQRGQKRPPGIPPALNPLSPPYSGSQCARCGAPVPPDAPQALCPRCVLAVGLKPTEPAAPREGSAAATGQDTPPSCAELAPHFAQYEILELIGHGGMGAVYKARQRDLDRLVALKVLTPRGIASDPAFALRFASEARALAKISHPNIVAVHEFGQAGPYYFFAMEYVDGPNLRQTLAAQRLRPQEALAIVPQICEALQFAHNHGVIHRDIKPENILLDRSGRVKIADFGLARLLGAGPQGPRLTASRDIMGTPHYMAPEQVEKPLEVDHRADIYSLGVVFYEMLTGELPMGRFPPPSRRVQVDVRLDEVVLRALEKDPQIRYQQASQVKADVETITNSGKTAPSSNTGPAADRALARSQLKVPALGLVIASISGPFMVGFLVSIGRLEVGAWMFWPFVLQLVATVLAAYGGLKAMRLESYRLAFAGGVAGCAMSFLNLLCLPFAVWFLAVLTRSHVKRAFVEPPTTTVSS